MKRLLVSPQFYWFLGHLATLYHSARIVLGSVRAYHYTRVLASVALTYGIVLYQYARSRRITVWSLRSLTGIDNAQYFFMALTLWILSLAGAGVTGAVFSPAIFAVFHSMNYTRDQLLAELPLAPAVRSRASAVMRDFISLHSARFLRFAQLFEVTTAFICGLELPWLTLRVLARGPSLTLYQLAAVITYLLFFKLRYTFNPATRELTAQCASGIGSNASRIGLGRQWLTLRNIVSKIF